MSGLFYRLCQLYNFHLAHHCKPLSSLICADVPIRKYLLRTLQLTMQLPPNFSCPPLMVSTGRYGRGGSIFHTRNFHIGLTCLSLSFLGTAAIMFVFHGFWFFWCCFVHCSQKDLDLFLEHTRAKFVGFHVKNDTRSLAGLPQPIHEGVKVLNQVGWLTGIVDHQNCFVSYCDHHVVVSMQSSTWATWPNERQWSPF